MSQMVISANRVTEAHDHQKARLSFEVLLFEHLSDLLKLYFSIIRQFLSMRQLSRLFPF